MEDAAAVGEQRLVAHGGYALGMAGRRPVDAEVRATDCSTNKARLVPGSWFWRSAASSLICGVVMVASMKRGRDGEPDRGSAILRWLLWKGFGASCGVRRPVGSIMPLHMLAKGRPSSSSQPRCIKGGSSSSPWRLWRGAMESPPSQVAKSPAMAKLHPSGTRLRFLSGCWGPLCEKQGPVCVFLLVLGLFVKVLCTTCWLIKQHRGPSGPLSCSKKKSIDLTSTHTDLISSPPSYPSSLIFIGERSSIGDSLSIKRDIPFYIC